MPIFQKLDSYIFQKLDSYIFYQFRFVWYMVWATSTGKCGLRSVASLTSEREQATAAQTVQSFARGH